MVIEDSEIHYSHGRMRPEWFPPEWFPNERCNASNCELQGCKGGGKERIRRFFPAPDQLKTLE